MNNVCGIKFSNRTKTIGADAEDPDIADRQFFAFATLCASLDVAKYVNQVDYSSNSCTYWIDVDQKHETNQIGGAIGWVADKTLDQFELFGVINHKGTLYEETGE